MVLSRIEREQRRDALLERLRDVREGGGLSKQLVREAAAAADVSPRTVYRWLSQGERRPRGHTAGWVLPERAFELLVQWRGNVAAGEDACREIGEERVGGSWASSLWFVTGRRARRR